MISGKEQDNDYLRICPNCKERGLVWTKRGLWESYICKRTYTSAKYERLLAIEKRNIEAKNKALRQHYGKDGHLGLCPFCGNASSKYGR